jgi:hypothetical protein
LSFIVAPLLSKDILFNTMYLLRCWLTLFTMQFVVRLTACIIQTFEHCNPEFKYSEALIPKRFLTNPSTPAHNDGLDNANWDLILYVNLELVNEKSNRRFVSSPT